MKSQPIKRNSTTEALAPSLEQLQSLLDKIITRIMRLLTRLGHLIEEEGIVYLARTGNTDPHNVLARGKVSGLAT